MEHNNQPHTACESSTVRDHPLVTVPWEDAEDLQALLLSHGIRTTACFDPLEHTAGLEVLNGTAIERVKEILTSREGSVSA